MNYISSFLFLLNSLSIIVFFLLSASKCDASQLQRSPVVGILTRHDFMPEHILSLHPLLVRSRWKRLRFRFPPMGKIF
jgi:hypothetical protein